MLKSLLIGFNIIGLFLFNFFMVDGVVVTHDLPSQLNPGEEREVQINISKAEIKGFAKLQVEINAGTIVSSVQNAGASFTFSDSKAKFIWVDLPAATEFAVKFKIKIADNAIGDQAVNIKFSYIENNERKNIDTPIHIISVGNNVTINANKIETPVIETKKEIEEISPPIVETKTEPAVPVVAEKIEEAKDNKIEPALAVENLTTTQSGQNIDITRTIKKQNNGNYIVVLEIQKEDIKGFAKLEEIVPDEFSAVSLESAKAIFSNSDKLVKFVWFSVPKDNLISVSYMLIPALENPISDFTLTGEFSYLDKNEVTQKQAISPTIIGNPAAAIAENIAEKANPKIIESNNLVPEKTADLVKIDSVKAEIKTAIVAPVAINTEIDKNIDVAENKEKVAAKEAADLQIVNDAIAKNITTPVVEKNKIVKPEIKEESIANKPIENKKPSADKPAIVESKEIAKAEKTSQEKSDSLNTAIAEPDKTKTKVIVYPITRIPYAEKGISYRVQISAGKKMIAKDYFLLKYNFSSDFITENHEGWIKYTTGIFTTYLEARNQRETIRQANKFPGPFVTAYSDGARITVQEALMATRQKWVS